MQQECPENGVGMPDKELKKTNSGYFCSRVNGEMMCVKFDDYIKNGFRLTQAKPYKEIFNRCYLI